MSTYTSLIIVTGGTTGLGYECAKAIAQQQPTAQVLICARSAGDEAAAAINNALGQQNVAYRRLDLGQLGDVRRFAAEVAADAQQQLGEHKISTLVLNAGVQVQTSAPTFSPEGVETTFAVNHVGHALLTYLLLPHLTGEARIVFTASGVHDPAQKTGMPAPVYASAAEVARPAEMAFNGNERYTTSKLCNVLWTYALARRLEQRVQLAGRAVTVTAMDPGLMPGTGLAREHPAALRFLWLHVLPRVIPLLRLALSPNVHSTAESGAALARLAVSADVRGVTGKYFEGNREIPSSKESYDEKRQEDLWEWTAEFLGRDAAEKEAYRTLSDL